MEVKKVQELNDRKGILDTSDAALVAYLNNGKASLTDSPVSSIASLMSEIDITSEKDENRKYLNKNQIDN